MKEEDRLYSLNPVDLATAIQSNLELDTEDLSLLVSEILNLREEEVASTLEEHGIV